MLIRVNAFNFLHQMVFEKMILKEFPFILTNLNPLHQRMVCLVPILVKINPVVLEKKQKMSKKLQMDIRLKMDQPLVNVS